MSEPPEAADRELRAEIHVDAPPSRVWEALTDLSRMPARSPELVRTVPLGRGPLRAGRQYVGINRRGPVVWPTRNRVVAVEPERMLVWDTVSSGARWVVELQPDGEGTRVVHRRPVIRGLTLASRVVAGTLLGGGASHATELEAGMRTTLEALKAEVEVRAKRGG
jgi:uncharacterized protein YndB with AHSA1/START domain